MRKLLALLALLPGLALAQSTTGGGVRANCPSCSLVQGSLTLSSTLASSATGSFLITSATTDGASAIAFKLQSTNAFSTSGDALLALYNSTNQRFLVDGSGTAATGVGTATPSVVGGNGTIAAIWLGINYASISSSNYTVFGDATNAYVNAPGGSGVTKFRTANVDKANVDNNGIFNGSGITCTAGTHCGTTTLSGGTATASVVSGCHAICTDTTAAAAVRCSVASTTLTITGTTTDVINWICF